MQVFVDESERRAYLLCALLVREDGPRLRSMVRGLSRPGQRRVHFAKEGDSNRRAILSALTDLGIVTRLYRCASSERHPRDHCLAALVGDVAADGARQLVLESRQSMDHLDEEVITATLRSSGKVLAYRHADPHNEPLLWVPDAVAWAVGRGGDWRRRAEPLVEKLMDVGP